MPIISNNLIGKIHIEEHCVIRINLAWIESVDKARELLAGIKNGVYLDFPSGRTKPPVPKITFDEALELCLEFKPKYFAMSNVENPDAFKILRSKIPKETELVPKIETKAGVQNFTDIVLAANIKTAMLDKEDLYTNSREEYEELVGSVRKQAKKAGINLLELAGVIFI